jgi:hypothetical protein
MTMRKILVGSFSSPASVRGAPEAEVELRALNLTTYVKSLQQ